MIDYITLRTEANAAPAVGRRALEADAGEARLLGVFTPQIGMSVNTILAVVGASEARALDEAGARLRGLEGVVGAEAARLEPVQERNLGLMRAGEAMFTNRWFFVQDGRGPDFEADTLGAWDEWERDTGCEVAGLWKGPAEGGAVPYLLVAKYQDLAAWTNSRFWVKAEGGARPDWVERFERRRTYMTDTWVTATRCIGPD